MNEKNRGRAATWLSVLVIFAFLYFTVDFFAFLFIPVLAMPIIATEMEEE